MLQCMQYHATLQRTLTGSEKTKEVYMLLVVMARAYKRVWFSNT